MAISNIPSNWRVGSVRTKATEYPPKIPMEKIAVIFVEGEID